MGATKRKPLEKWQTEDAARLRALFEAKAKLSQQKFGETYEIGSQGAVWQYLDGRIPLNLPVAIKFAKGLGCKLGEISPRLAVEQSLIAKAESHSNVTPGPEARGKVPIISWVQAGNWSSAVDNFHPGDADEWAETTVPIHRHTYALRVRGDSMTNPSGEPTFPDGQVIVVEPDAVDAPDKLIGSYVIVKRVVDDEATFKQLVKDAGRYYLKPLNPRYPMLELQEGDVLCGVVREKVVRYF